MTDRPSQPSQSNHARHAADYRRRHRRQQHDQAHADGLEHPPEERVDLDGIFAGQAELIDQQPALDACVARLQAAGAFAYDTEFIGEMSYRPLVCLIQVATDDYIGLIDPLAPGIDLGGFWKLMCDPAIHTIVHAGEQDLEHVWRANGSAPTNVLDTQVVAGFIGLSYPASLAKLVGEFTGIKLQKGFTFTDWTLRPLSASQLKYAADDVRYLPAIERAIRERLTRLERLDWATDECEARCVNSEPGFDPETSWQRVRGGGSLDGRAVNILKLLVAWREACAQRADVPARTFLKDEILVDLCKSRPKTIDKLTTIRHLPRPVVEHHGKEILDMVVLGLSQPPTKLEGDGDGEPSLTDRFRYDSVWAVVQTICVAQSLDPALVTSRQDTIDVYRRISSGRDVSAERLLNGWRAKAVGDSLRQMASGSLPLSAEWTSGALRMR